jgi:hypothetical protein
MLSFVFMLLNELGFVFSSLSCTLSLLSHAFICCCVSHQTMQQKINLVSLTLFLQSCTSICYYSSHVSCVVVLLGNFYFYLFTCFSMQGKKNIGSLLCYSWNWFDDLNILHYIPCTTWFQLEW